MRLTAQQLRRIIREEVSNVKRARRLRESADRTLYAYDEGVDEFVAELCDEVGCAPPSLTPVREETPTGGMRVVQLTFGSPADKDDFLAAADASGQPVFYENLEDMMY